MSGITIEQAIGYANDGEASQGTTQEDTPKTTMKIGDFSTPEGYEPFGFFKKRTGIGELEEYERHVLNFNHSSWMSRIIRGLTGIVGDLDFAIVDITIGIMEFLNTRRGANVKKSA